MRKLLLAVSVALLLAAPLSAQEANPEEKPRRAKRVASTGEGAKGAVPLEQTRERARGIDEMAARLKKELSLDAAQTTQFDALVAKMRDNMGQQRGKSDEIKPLVEQMREAVKAGDSARANELREQIKAQRGPSNPMEDFYTEVEGILRDDQKAALAKVRERSQPKLTRPERSPIERIAEMRERLELTPEQAPQFDRLAQELQSKLKNRAAATPDGAQMDVIADLKAAIDAGDTKRIEELKEELTSAAPNDPSDEAWDDFYDGLGGFLSDAQMDKVDRARSHMIDGGGKVDARTLLKLAHRLELSSEQRKQLRDVERAAREGAREARRERSTAGEFDKKIEAQIREILTPEQTQEFDELLGKQRESAAKRPAGERERGGKRKARQNASEGGSGDAPAPEEPAEEHEEETP